MARKALIVKTERRQKELLRSLQAGKDPKFPTRVYNRCKLCGRSRGFIRHFQMCRICFRELARKGEITGLRKSSW